MWINFHIIILVLEGLDILYLVEETFLHQKNIKSEGKATLGTLLDFAYLRWLFTNTGNCIKTR